jgi:hypothetical protein
LHGDALRWALINASGAAIAGDGVNHVQTVSVVNGIKSADRLTVAAGGAGILVDDRNLPAFEILLFD